MNDTEAVTNIRLVEALCALWDAADYNAEMLLPFFTEDCAVRFVHTLPFAHGHTALLEQARQLMPLGTERMKVKHLSTQLAGPLIVSHRIDTLINSGQPDTDWEMLGVFLFVDGKIKEWTDYMLTPFAQAEDGTVVPA